MTDNVTPISEDLLTVKRLLEKEAARQGDTACMIVIAMNHEGRVSVNWTAMKTKDLAFMAAIGRRVIEDEILGE